MPWNSPMKTSEILSSMSAEPSLWTSIFALKSEMRQLRGCEPAGPASTAKQTKRPNRLAPSRAPNLAETPGATRTLELHHRGGTILGGLGLEELARLEAEHSRNHVAGESRDLGVQIANDGVVVAARVLNCVLGLAER